MVGTLSKHGFLRAHKSYLVNQQYIEEIRRRDYTYFNWKWILLREENGMAD